MSNLIINKGSSKYAILSLGIALFLFMFFFTFLFLGDKLNNSSQSKTVVLYELKNGHPSNSLDLISHEIKIIETMNVSSEEIISKNKALDYFKEDFDAQLYDQLKNNTPFKDILKFEIFGDMLNSDLQSLRQIAGKFDNFISDVRIETSQKSFNPIKDGFTKILFPFLLLCLIFCVIIISGNINSDLKLNKIEIKRSVISGIHPKVLYNNLRSIMLNNLGKSIILALALYFSTFYLISYYLSVNFSEFGFYIFLKPIFTSILLVLLGLIFLVHNKVSKFIKSI